MSEQQNDQSSNKKEEEMQPKFTQADLIAQRVIEAQKIMELWKMRWADKLSFVDWVRFELVLELGKKVFS